MKRLERVAPDEIMTPAEVARALRVDPKTVTRWANQGKIPFALTPGGHRRFRADDVEAFLNFGYAGVPGE
jgi:excisionase family DNA binding protein